jgi:hypothetical protein
MEEQLHTLIYSDATSPELVKKIHAEAAGLKSPRELPPFVAKLEGLVEQGQARIEELPAFVEWRVLNQMQHDLERGRVDMRFLQQSGSVRYGYEGPPVAQRLDLRSSLFSAGVPVFLGLPPLKKEDPSEPPLRYFAKVTTQAVAERNWDQLSRITGLIRQLRLEEVASPLDICGVESFLGARLFEKAGQAEFAVAMDELALSTGCQVLPIELIAQSLAKERHRDPAAFERGASMLLHTGVERRKNGTNRLPSP